MLLAVIVLSTSILSSVIVASTIVLSQLRQTVNIMDSARAAYAADSGLECGLYTALKDPTFTCDRDAAITCGTDVSGPFCQLANNAKFRIFRTGALPLQNIKSIGESGRATRAFEVFFTQITQCNDGADNETIPDGLIDLADPQCTSAADTDESI